MVCVRLKSGMVWSGENVCFGAMFLTNIDQEKVWSQKRSPERSRPHMIVTSEGAAGPRKET